MSINEYYVYVGDYVNFFYFEGNLIFDKVFNIFFEVWSWIESKNGFFYCYVEVIDWRGIKYFKDYYYVNLFKVNFFLFVGDNYYFCGGYDDLIVYVEIEDKLCDIIKENENKLDYGFNCFDWW